MSGVSSQGLTKRDVETVCTNLAGMGWTVRPKSGEANGKLYVATPPGGGAPLTIGPSDNYKEARQLYVRLRHHNAVRAMNFMRDNRPTKRRKPDPAIADKEERPLADPDGKWIPSDYVLPDNIVERTRDAAVRYAFTPYSLSRCEQRGIGPYEVYLTLTDPLKTQSGKKPGRRVVVRNDIAVVVQESTDDIITVYDRNGDLREITGIARQPLSPASPPAPEVFREPQQPAAQENPTMDTSTATTIAIEPVPDTGYQPTWLDRTIEIIWEVYKPGDAIEIRDVSQLLGARSTTADDNTYAAVSQAMVRLHSRDHALIRTGRGRYILTDPDTWTNVAAAWYARRQQAPIQTPDGPKAVIEPGIPARAALTIILDTEYKIGDTPLATDLCERLAPLGYPQANVRFAADTLVKKGKLIHARVAGRVGYTLVDPSAKPAATAAAPAPAPRRPITVELDPPATAEPLRPALFSDVDTDEGATAFLADKAAGVEYMLQLDEPPMPAPAPVEPCEAALMLGQFASLAAKLRADHKGAWAKLLRVAADRLPVDLVADTVGLTLNIRAVRRPGGMVEVYAQWEDMV